MINYQNVTPGETYAPESAERHNAVNRLLNAGLRARGDCDAAALRAVLPSTSFISGKNTTTNAIGQYTPVWIAGIAAADAAAAGDAVFEIATRINDGGTFDGGVPQYAWGVTQDVIRPGETGLVMLRGITEYNNTIYNLGTLGRASVANLDGYCRLVGDYYGSVCVIGESSNGRVIAFSGADMQIPRSCPAIVKYYDNHHLGVELYANGYDNGSTGDAVLVMLDCVPADALPPVGAKIIAHPYLTAAAEGGGL